MNQNDKIAELRMQADQAIQDGHDPEQVDARFIELAKQSRIDSIDTTYQPDNSYEIEKEAQYNLMQNAIKYGRDPKLVQNKYDETMTNMALNRMLEPQGLEKIGVPVAAAALGAAKTMGNIALGGAELLTKLGEQLFPSTKNTSKSIGDFRKGLAQSIEAEPVVKAAPTAETLGGLMVPGLGAAAGVAEKGIVGALGAAGITRGANIAASATTGAALGAAMEPETPGLGAAIGGTLGTAAGILTAPLNKLQRMGAKTQTAEFKDTAQNFKDLNINPTYAQATANLGTKQTAEAVALFPMSGGVQGIESVGNLKIKIGDKIESINPRDSIQFIDQLDPKGAITTVEGLDKAYLDRLITNPKVSNKPLPMADPQMVADIQGLITKYKTNPDPNSKPTGSIMRLLDLANPTKHPDGVTLEGAILAKRGIDADLKAIRNGTSNLPVADQQILTQAGDIIRSRTIRMADELGVGPEYQGYNKWFQASKDYQNIKEAFDGAINPKNYDEFDPQMLLTSFNKIMKDAKLEPKTNDARNVINGIRKIIPQFKSQREEQFGGLKKTLAKVANSATATAIGAGSVMAGGLLNPLVWVVGGTYATGIKMINTLLNNPKGLNILQKIGKDPKGVEKAKEFVRLLGRTATIGATEQQGQQQ